MVGRFNGKPIMALVSLLIISPLIIAHSSPEVFVKMDPTSIETSPGESFIVAVKVDPGNYGISGGEVNIAFDPSVFNAEEVDVGDLFGPEPLEGFKEVDNEAGTIRYAIARKGATIPPTPPGTFIKITFRTLKDAKPGTYEIEITEIGLADEKFQDIPQAEIEVTGAKVVVTTILPTETTTTVTVTTTVTQAATTTAITTTTVTTTSPIMMTRYFTSITTRIVERRIIDIFYTIIVAGLTAIILVSIFLIISRLSLIHI